MSEKKVVDGKISSERSEGFLLNESNITKFVRC